MDKPRTGRSARWGAACAPCAAAKTRCIRTQPSGQRQCDRCQSLEKDCVGQIPGPRKKRQVKPSFDRRTALPEEDLNDVVFSSTTPIEEGSTVHGSSSNGSVDHAPDVHAVPLVSIEPQARVSISRAEIAINTPAYNLISSPPTALNCTCIATLTLEDRNPVDSDETLLSTYRNQLSNAFPFVIIPTGTTPRQLQTTRPFLMKVIRMVTSVRHLRSVRGQSRAVMEHISDAILMRSERSLDLLQGILVFLGFYHYHCMAHAQLNNLIRLAISLVEDLELSSCSKSQRRKGQLPLVRAEEPMFRTNEEKRALLGVWYISSNAGLVVEQLAFTKFTKYMDQCLTELGDASENKTDQLAIQLVRIQQHTEKIFHFHSSDSLAGKQQGSHKSPIMARMEAFRSELDSLRNPNPPHLQSDYYLACYYNSACLRIFEPLLAGSHLPDADHQSLASLSLSGVPISDVFSHFTTALKAWVDNWLAIPVCSYFYMSQPAYVQLVHGAMMLSRWVRVAGPSAVKLSYTGTAMSQEGLRITSQPMPALSGVPSCPDLSLPKSPACMSAQIMSTQLLNALRTKVISEPDLWVDVLGILDTMAARFEAAKNEMAAAQGLIWENNTWDFAAEHLKMKKSRVEKWCEMVTIAAGERRSPPTDVHNSVHEWNRETMDVLPGQSVDDFGWATSNYDWDTMQWESVLFDELLQDIQS